MSNAVLVQRIKSGILYSNVMLYQWLSCEPLVKKICQGRIVPGDIDPVD